jgi:phosphopantothenoylcysteine synthetase/decarboxylase
MGIKNKKILITAGPTWVPIDKVRVISNTATGETGILLAEKLTNLPLKVTLLLGPVAVCCLNKNIRVIHFKFFDELKNKIIRELKAKKYDAVIHSAAVSDYLPAKISYTKVKSGLKNWKVAFKPAPKIIDLIRKIGPGIFLVGFKFEPAADKARLIKSAKALMLRCGLDLTVANALSNGKYRAYILSGEKISPVLTSKAQMAARLVSIISKAL